MPPVPLFDAARRQAEDVIKQPNKRARTLPIIPASVVEAANNFVEIARSPAPTIANGGKSFF